MLFIKFQIQDQQKYQDFQKVYEHMVTVRQPNFQFQEEDEDFDWENSSEEEIDQFLNKSEPEIIRYHQLFPAYANTVLEKYIKEDQKIAGAYGFNIEGIFNYLEFGFEVDLDKLTQINANLGLVEFSTGNYPFGGLERFIMTLKAFDLSPIECFDGFYVFEFKWTSNFDYEAIQLQEKTKLYLNENKKS